MRHLGELHDSVSDPKMGSPAPRALAFEPLDDIFVEHPTFGEQWEFVKAHLSGIRYTLVVVDYFSQYCDPSDIRPRRHFLVQGVAMHWIVSGLETW